MSKNNNLISDLPRDRLWGLLFVYLPILLPAIFYITWVDNIFDSQFIFDFIVLVTSLTCYLAYGALVNDYFDLLYDKSCGKYRFIQKLSRKQAISLIVCILILGFIVTALFIQKISYISVYLLSFIFVTQYSAPPLRLKDKGVWGVLCDTLIEWSSPVILIFLFFSHIQADMLLFIMVYVVAQVVSILNHQLLDYRNDLKTGTSTFVVRIGIQKTIRILNGMYTLALALILMLFVLFTLKIPYFWIILVITPVTYIFYVMWFRKIRMSDDPFALIYHPHLAGIYLFIISAIFKTAIPLFMALLLAFKYNPYVILLLFTFICNLKIMKEFIDAVRHSFK